MFESEIKFIQKVYKEFENIPLHIPRFIGNEKKYVLDAIDSTFVSSVGNYVSLVESRINAITNSEYCVAVVNGTSALQIALKVVGVQQGDEVLTQALTFVATANAICYLGASPIFLDVDYSTMGLSPDSVQKFLQTYIELKNGIPYNKLSGKKVSACVPMHTFGFPVRITELKEVCSKWNIPIVEDAAESLGSYYKNKHTGTFGDIGIFSFNGNKIVTSGGGGAIICNSKSTGEYIRHLTTTAKVPHKFDFYHDQIGYNFRMPNLNAALLYAQLENLNLFLQSKREISKIYTDYFSKKGIKFRNEPINAHSNYWLMCIELQNKRERDTFLEESNNAGVMTRPIWKLMHNLPMFRDCYRDTQENTIHFESTIVNIPSSSLLT